MKNKSNVHILFFITINLFIFYSCSETNTAEEVLKGSLSTMQSMDVINYAVDYKIKYFDKKDTTFYKSHNVLLKSVPTDTVLGYHAIVTSQFFQKIYDGKKFLALWPKAKEAVADDISKNGGRFTKNNIVREVIINDVLLGAYIKSAVKISFDDNYTNTKSWKIYLDYPADEEITFRQKVIYVNKETMLPNKIEHYAKFMDLQDEYFEHSLSYNNTKKDVVKSIYNVFVPKDFKVMYNSPKSHNIPKILQEGSEVIGFSALDMEGKERKVDLNSNELIVIDFWHLACAPCLQAMPELDALFKRYQNKGLRVYGINPIDKEKDEDLLQFLDKLNIEYDILKVKDKIANQFNVSSYPALFIIKNNKVILSKSGFVKGDELTIEKFIRDNI